MPDSESGYFDYVRDNLLDLFPRPPRRLLDVGCGTGATSAAAKTRWPGLQTIGIELVPAAADVAATRLDRVITASVEAVDLAAAGLDGVDGVLLADVLEHLVDPWTFLRRLRDAIDPNATIVASIPNIANLWLLDEIASGRFNYEAAGLLDATHLRFFTRTSIGTLFDHTGYTIERWGRINDNLVDRMVQRRFLGIMLPLTLPGRLLARRVSGRNVTVRNVDGEMYRDLRTLQFTVVAHPKNREK